MRQFSLLKAPYHSLVSRELYVDVARRWGANTLGYLLLVVAVLWIPFLFQARAGWSEFMAVEAPFFTEQIPPITIDHGRVTVDAEQPWLIRSPIPDGVVAIIDTSGRFTSLEGTAARVLVTDTQVIVRKNDTETRIFDLSGIEAFHLDAQRVEHWLQVAGTWGLLLLYPAVVLAAFCYHLVQALLYALLGLLIAGFLKCRLGYSAVLRVAIVALTPALLLKTVLSTVGVELPFAGFLYFLVAMGYLAFGLAANRENPRLEGGQVPGGVAG